MSLTPRQQQFINHLHDRDILAIRKLLGITSQELIAWEKDDGFRYEFLDATDKMRLYAHHEIFIETMNLLTAYKNLQEHMPMSDRVEFLKSITELISITRPPRDYVKSAVEYGYFKDAMAYRNEHPELFEDEDEEEEEEKPVPPVQPDPPEESADSPRPELGEGQGVRAFLPSPIQNPQSEIQNKREPVSFASAEPEESMIKSANRRWSAYSVEEPLFHRRIW